MNRKVVGYFEGTDPVWLTSLVARGHDTLPVSNGYDGHGKNVRLFSGKDKVHAVIGYLHKVVAPPRWEASTEDILQSCFNYNVPVLLAVPKELHEDAKKLLGTAAKKVKLVDPAKMLDALKKALG
jgi:hypothetical protein